jgi:hypothetical protein
MDGNDTQDWDDDCEFTLFDRIFIPVILAIIFSANLLYRAKEKVLDWLVVILFLTILGIIFICSPDEWFK